MQCTWYLVNLNSHFFGRPPQQLILTKNFHLFPRFTRMSEQISKLYLYSKMPNNGIPEYFAILRYIERKNQLLRAYRRHNKTKRGIPILSQYTFFWHKCDIAFHVAFQNCQRVYRVFSARLRYIERKEAIEGTTKPRGGTNTVYCHSIPLAKHTMPFFVLSWF